MQIYDIKVKSSEGQEVSLSQYENQVLLIVNTATGCGFTPQYEGLEKLYRKYQNQGLVILDFPCNQFGNQAPGTIEEIHEFCSLNYQTTFPLFSKIDVNGPHEDPLFSFLKKAKKGIFWESIKWNFTKFLINRQGEVVKRFAPTDTPEKIEEHIVKLL